jgi:HD-GYP domain-containing protein (c-di-GMP phosphodiesterase class II)
MSALTLSYPVYTLDYQLLLPENTEITDKTLDDLISLNKQAYKKTYSLFQYGSFKKDLINFLNDYHYRTIFSDQKKTDKILNILEEVHLIHPVIESLEYFKMNDPYTYRHVLTVFALSTLLSMDLISRRKDFLKEVLAGPAHDIGKICVPLNILQKTSPLTKRDKNLLEHHTAAGYILLSYYYRDRQNFFAKVARDHHERRDGSGYPRGQKLRDLMIEIVAVSDIYDALISQRPYRPISYDNRSALEEITKMAERNILGWNVVKALVSLNRKSKPSVRSCKVSREKRGTPPLDNKYGLIISARDYQISDDIKRLTTRCSDDFHCLFDDYWAMCSIERPLKGAGLIIGKRRNNNNCKYLMSFGNAYICNCPTRYELHQQYRI